MDEKVNLPLKQYWRLLVDYLKPQKGQVTLLAVLLLGSIGLQLANPQIVRYFLDIAEAGSGMDKLFGAAALFMGVAIVRQIVQIAATYVAKTWPGQQPIASGPTWLCTASSWICPSTKGISPVS